MNTLCLPLKLPALRIYLFPACGAVSFVWKKLWSDSYENNNTFVEQTSNTLKTALVSMLINFSICYVFLFVLCSFFFFINLYAFVEFVTHECHSYCCFFFLFVCF